MREVSSDIQTFRRTLPPTLLLTWMVKDLSWTLYCAPAALASATASVILAVFLVTMDWPTDTPGLRVQGIVDVLWLLGNSVWMFAEMLWERQDDPISKNLPWYDGPLLHVDDQIVARAETFCVALMLCGLLIYCTYYGWVVLGYLLTARRRTHGFSTEGRRQLVFGVMDPEEYVGLFIGPWIGKDIFWSIGRGWETPMILCGLLVMITAADHLHRFGGERFVAQFFWFCSNAVWAWGEVILEDKLFWPRIVAAVLMGLGIVVVLQAILRNIILGPPAGAEEAEAEKKPLISRVRAHSSSGAHDPEEGRSKVKPSRDASVPCSRKSTKPGSTAELAQDDARGDVLGETGLFTSAVSVWTASEKRASAPSFEALPATTRAEPGDVSLAEVSTADEDSDVVGDSYVAGTSGGSSTTETEKAEDLECSGRTQPGKASAAA